MDNSLQYIQLITKSILVLGCVFSKSNSDSSSNDEGLELVAVLNPYAYTVILGIMMSKVGLYIEVKNFCQPPTGPDSLATKAWS